MNLHHDLNCLERDIGNPQKTEEILVKNRADLIYDQRGYYAHERDRIRHPGFAQPFALAARRCILHASAGSTTCAARPSPAILLPRTQPQVQHGRHARQHKVEAERGQAMQVLAEQEQHEDHRRRKPIGAQVLLHAPQRNRYGNGDSEEDEERRVGVKRHLHELPELFPIDLPIHVERKQHRSARFHSACYIVVCKMP